MQTDSFASFLEQLETLPPLPAVAREMLHEPAPTVDELVGLLHNDPGTAAKILRVANSPYFGMPRRVGEVSRAIVLLGVRAVRNLVLYLCARSVLIAELRDLTHYERISQHSFAVAAVCELLASAVNYHSAEKAFLTGLLHDVGLLAMSVFSPSDVEPLLALPTADRLAAERATFGIDHAKAGGCILQRWEFPEQICTAVRLHHQEDISNVGPDQAMLLAILMLADEWTTDASSRTVRDFASERARAAAHHLRLTELQQVEIREQMARRICGSRQLSTSLDDRAREPLGRF